MTLTVITPNGRIVETGLSQADVNRKITRWSEAREGLTIRVQIIVSD